MGQLSRQPGGAQGGFGHQVDKGFWVKDLGFGLQGLELIRGSGLSAWGAEVEVC